MTTGLNECYWVIYSAVGGRCATDCVKKTGSRNEHRVETAGILSYQRRRTAPFKEKSDLRGTKFRDAGRRARSSWTSVRDASLSGTALPNPVCCEEPKKREAAMKWNRVGVWGRRGNSWSTAALLSVLLLFLSACSDTESHDSPRLTTRSQALDAEDDPADDLDAADEPDVPPDGEDAAAGETGEAQAPGGDPCASDTDCPDGAECLNLYDHGFESGYCARPCTDDDAVCDVDGACWRTTESDDSHCMAACDPAESARAGYFCMPFGPDVGVLVPTGLPGTPCAGNNDCWAPARREVCLADTVFGGTSGTCSMYCEEGSFECPPGLTCQFIMPYFREVCVAACEPDGSCADPDDQCVGGVCVTGCTQDGGCATGTCNADTGRCSAQPEVCDGLGGDEDADGNADCADADCEASCGVDACTSGGVADCLDANCADHVDCLTPTAELGEACAHDAQCGAITDGFCMSELGSGLPGGACTTACAAIGASCGPADAGLCIPMGETGGICIPTCTQGDPQACGARSGYMCIPMQFDPALPPADACMPFCGLDPSSCEILSSCSLPMGFCAAAAEVCDDSNLVDEDSDGLRNCADPDCAGDASCASVAVGDACSGAIDCGGYTCLPESSGFPGGLCTSYCDGPFDVCGPDGVCAGLAGAAPVCLDSCDLTTPVCRTGYGCQDVGDGTGACAPLVPIGGPCSVHGDCASDHCRTSAEFPFQPGGYCSADCSVEGCPEGALCVPFPDEGLSLCFATCEAGQECRSGGYQCVDPGVGVGLCIFPPPSEADCHNGSDDDNDGVCDCADDDCHGELAPCSAGDPEICGDGIDNDGDCAVDCDDDECSSVDSDSDGSPDCVDGCPGDAGKVAPGSCGCGVSDDDGDGDGTPDCNDGCPGDPSKVEPGVCGCGVSDADSDSDGTLDCNDACPTDAGKTDLGECGCGVADTDGDGDGTPDCNDGCPDDGEKTDGGGCGCGVADADGDGDGTPDCNDGCPDDPNKTAPGSCGCGVSDADGDGDGTADCNDLCPQDGAKTEPGDCGCGEVDDPTDLDADDIPDCVDDDISDLQGASCGSDDDCGILDCLNPYEHGFPAGYCARDCSDDSAICDAGDICMPSGHDDQSHCIVSCADDSACRSGYACVELFPGASACLPGGVMGDNCIVDNDCWAPMNQGLCVDEATFGLPQGACTMYCEDDGSGCMPGYSCEFVTPLFSNVCLPSCASDTDCGGAACVDELCQFGCTADTDCLSGACNLDSGRCVQTKESCTNPGDEDHDGLIDCDDADCFAVCDASEICPVDAGLPDCSDPTCDDHPGCEDAVPFGGPCVSDAQCRFGEGVPSVCMTEREFGLPGGACTHYCNDFDAPCGDGTGHCAEMDEGGICIPTCVLDDPGACGARDGLTCVTAQFGDDDDPVDVCMFDCSASDGAACEVLPHCNSPRGQCWATAEVCDDPEAGDEDKDGLRNCADQDCWGESFCPDLGAECAHHGECLGMVCAPPDQGYDGGQCTVFCEEGPFDACGPDASCVGQVYGDQACLAHCVPGAGDCREGYDCHEVEGVDVCAPVQAIGGPCQVNADCASGQCASQEMTGVPGGMCTVFDCAQDADCLGQGVCLEFDGGMSVCVGGCDQQGAYCRYGEGNYWCQDVGNRHACLPDPGGDDGGGAEEDCFNPGDEDGNGTADCFDPACASSGMCGPEVCDDRIDNDNDGDTDCGDDECNDRPCDVFEYCGDGWDNDGNGVWDCDDPACQWEYPCSAGVEFDCNDHIDNDADWLWDCADPDCQQSGSGGCGPVEICDDHIDNDGNGWADCQDVEACPQGVAPCDIERCDGLDNDNDGLWDHEEVEALDTTGDGYVGCEDAGCAQDADWCQQDGEIGASCWNNRDCDTNVCLSRFEHGLPNGMCSLFCEAEEDCPFGSSCVGGLLEGGESVCAPTCGAQDDCEDGYQCTDAGVCEPHCTHDWQCWVGRCDFTTNRCVSEDCWDGVDTNDSGGSDCADQACIDAFGECPSEEYDCSNGVDDDGDGAIDCADESDCGSEGHCSITERNCGDNIDNDGQNGTDCADPACAGNDWCGEEVCWDWVDNDGDGVRDCEDPDCQWVSICEAVEADCNDGFDNDGDGFRDCEDWNCRDRDFCESGAETLCSDHFDNDGDNSRDCEDPDCQGDPVCGDELCDGHDNDGDGWFDHGELELDTNGNGYVDCDDAGCAENADWCHPGQTGDECWTADDCVGDICLDRWWNGWPNGYCTQACDLAVPASCAGGTTCVEGLYVEDPRDGVVGDVTACAATCANNDDCRNGYTCEADAPVPYCRPECRGGFDCYASAQCTPIGVCRFEVCDDGIDNDLDGAVDCDDDENCDAWLHCILRERCNGIDDDGDGQIDEDLRLDTNENGVLDCTDDDCGTDLLWCSGGVVGTECVDSSECADAECLSESESGWPAGSCTSPCNPHTTGGCGNGATCVAGLDGGQSACASNCLNDGDCRDGWLCELTAPDPYCSPRCEHDSQCESGSCIEQTGRCRSEDCTDGADNDYDGFTDCEDPDCSGSCVDACDGIDNDANGTVDDGFEDSDGDGQADCVDACPDDNQRWDDPGQCGCGYEESDTDQDGTADCNDSETCDDGEDNDGDGAIDCMDTDCACGSVPLGSPCDSDLDCGEGMCLLEAEHGFPSGYCSTPCSPTDGCLSQGRCENLGPGHYCLLSCADDDECRLGTSCQSATGGLACRAACRSDEHCASTGGCNRLDGLCTVATELCTDGIDNDGNRLTDCLDPTCYGAPECEAQIVVPDYIHGSFIIPANVLDNALWVPVDPDIIDPYDPFDPTGPAAPPPGPPATLAEFLPLTLGDLESPDAVAVGSLQAVNGVVVRDPIVAVSVTIDSTGRAVATDLRHAEGELFIEAAHLIAGPMIWRDPAAPPQRRVFGPEICGDDVCDGICTYCHRSPTCSRVRTAWSGPLRHGLVQPSNIQCLVTLNDLFSEDCLLGATPGDSAPSVVTEVTQESVHDRLEECLGSDPDSSTLDAYQIQGLAQCNDIGVVSPASMDLVFNSPNPLDPEPCNPDLPGDCGCEQWCAPRNETGCDPDGAPTPNEPDCLSDPLFAPDTDPTEEQWYAAYGPDVERLLATLRVEPEERIPQECLYSLFPENGSMSDDCVPGADELFERLFGDLWVDGELVGCSNGVLHCEGNRACLGDPDGPTPTTCYAVDEEGRLHRERQFDLRRPDSLVMEGDDDEEPPPPPEDPCEDGGPDCEAEIEHRAYPWRDDDDNVTVVTHTWDIEVTGHDDPEQNGSSWQADWDFDPDDDDDTPAPNPPDRTIDHPETLGTTQCAFNDWRCGAPEAEPGANTTNGDKTGDPVLLPTGELFHQTNDLAVSAGTGLPLAFGRTYRSGAQTSGHLGRNWQHNLEERFVLVDRRDGFAVLPSFCFQALPVINCISRRNGATGGELYLFDAERFVFVPSAGSFATIRPPGEDGLYHHRTADGLATAFDSSGRVYGKVDALGNAIHYEYDAQGRLVAVTTDRGASLALKYGLWGLLESVSDHTGRSVAFHYELTTCVGTEDYENAGADRAHYRNGPRATTFGAAEAVARGWSVPASCDQDPIAIAIRQVEEAMGSGTAALPESLQRSFARLVQVEIRPAPSSSGAFDTGAAEPIRYRYRYSKVPYNHHFLTRYLEGVDLPHLASLTCGPGDLDESRQQLAELVGEIRQLEGRITSIERALHPGEYASGALTDDSPNEFGGPQYWAIELESRYDWDTDSPTLGHVVAQRYGTATDAMPYFAPPPQREESSTSDVWPTDQWLTDRPLHTYHWEFDPEIFGPTLPSGVDPVVVDPPDDPEDDRTACELIAEEFPSFRNDLLVPADLDALPPEEAHRFSHGRSDRAEGLNEICALAVTIDRVGVVRRYGLNFLGQTVLEEVHDPEVVVDRRTTYNGDGNPVQFLGHDGLAVNLTYDDDAAPEDANPLSRRNIVRVHSVPGASEQAPGLATLPSWVVDELDGAKPQTVRFDYEPLTNGVRLVEDHRGNLTETVFEYQRHVGAYFEAALLAGSFGVRNPRSSALPLELSSGEHWARPLPVEVRHPSAVPGETGLVESYSYDAFGALLTHTDSVQGENVYTYGPTLQPTLPYLDALVALPDRDASAAGGDLETATSALIQPSFDEFGQAEQLQLVTTYQWNPAGQLIQVVEPSLATTDYEFDSLGQLARVEHADGALTEYLRDGAGRTVRQRTWNHDGTLLSGIRTFRSSVGDVLGVCQETNWNGCERPLWELVAGRNFSISAADGPLPDAHSEYRLTTISYDGEGRPWEQISPAGRGIRTLNGALGVSSITRFMATDESSVGPVRLVLRSADTARPTMTVAVGDGESLATRVATNGFGQVVAEQTGAGPVDFTTYDAHGSVDGIGTLGAEPGDPYEVYQYSSFDRGPTALLDASHDWEVRNPLAQPPVPTSPGPTHRTTTITRDAFGRVTQVEEPGTPTVVLTYGNTNTPTTTDSSDGSHFARYLDPASSLLLENAGAGNPDVDQWAFGQRRRVFFNPFGQPLGEEISLAGDVAASKWTYDGLGRTVSSVGPDRDISEDVSTRTTVFTERGLGGSWIRSTVGSHNIPPGEEEPRETELRFDGDGFLTTLVDPSGRTSLWRYDYAGRRVSQTVPGTAQPTATTTWGYDGFGRLDSLTHPDDTALIYLYNDDTGWLEQIVAGADSVDLMYDPLGRVDYATRTETRNGISAVVDTDRVYLPSGELSFETTIADANGLHTERVMAWQNDPSTGLLEQVNLPSAASIVVAERDDHGSITELDYVFDNGAPAGYSAHLSYRGPVIDQLELTQRQDGSMAPWLRTDWDYDDAGRPIEQLVSDAAADQPLSIHRRWYNAVGQAVIDEASWLEPQAVDWRVEGTVPRYNAFAELAGEDVAGSVARPPISVDTSIDDVRAWLTDASLTSAYSVDRNQLGTATAVTDPAGGTLWEGATQTGSPAYDDVTLSEGELDLSWDARGQLESDGARNLEWTYDGLVAEVDSPFGTEELIYDAFGRVVRVHRDGGALDLSWSGAEIVQEHVITDEGVDCATRTWFATSRLNQPAGYELAATGACSGDVAGLLNAEEVDLGADPVVAFGLGQNLRADSVVVVDQDGFVVESSEYSRDGDPLLRFAFADGAGVEVAGDGAQVGNSQYGNPLGFNGARVSGVSGLYYMRARHYDPRLRVFVSRDPLGYVDGFDPWRFGAGDPLNRWDPFGLEAESRARAGKPAMSPYQGGACRFGDGSVPASQSVGLCEEQIEYVGDDRVRISPPGGLTRTRLPNMGANIDLDSTLTAAGTVPGLDLAVDVTDITIGVFTGDKERIAWAVGGLLIPVAGRVGRAAAEGMVDTVRGVTRTGGDAGGTVGQGASRGSGSSAGGSSSSGGTSNSGGSGGGSGSSGGGTGSSDGGSGFPEPPQLADDVGPTTVRTRPTPGEDGATSHHLLESVDGETNSVTHQVVRDGEVIHQHQTHVGSHGTKRQFPNEWVNYWEVP